MARRLSSAALIILILLPAHIAGAQEFAACWTTTATNSWGRLDSITRCRLSGGATVDYASDASVPSRLYPNLGTDVTGECWYYTSRVTQYVILALYPGGEVDMGYDPDPSAPGGVIAIGPTIPRCSSEPIPAPDPLTEVWDYVTTYIHAPPTLDLNPRIGEGVTGMDTYLGVPVPDRHTATISSVLSIIDLEVEVSAIHVDWGDGTIETYPAHSEILSGYPDGGVIHLYETKDPEGVSISVSYDWTARWRRSGGAWQPLDPPNTTTTVVYPLYEIISVLTR